MRKPKITEGPWRHDGRYWVDSDHQAKNIVANTANAHAPEEKKIANAKAISAVPEMIDALIGAYLFIDDMPIDERKERHLKVYNSIADALQKAGVEL